MRVRNRERLRPHAVERTQGLVKIFQSHAADHALRGDVVVALLQPVQHAGLAFVHRTECGMATLTLQGDEVFARRNQSRDSKSGARSDDGNGRPGDGSAAAD